MSVHSSASGGGLGNALDNRHYAAAIMMDLSKAFDCLPHGLLHGKLRAYGLSVKACALVSSYLSDRKQTVKLGPHYSEWSNITKGPFWALCCSICL